MGSKWLNDAVFYEIYQIVRKILPLTAAVTRKCYANAHIKRFI